MKSTAWSPSLYDHQKQMKQAILDRQHAFLLSQVGATPKKATNNVSNRAKNIKNQYQQWMKNPLPSKTGRMVGGGGGGTTAVTWWNIGTSGTSSLNSATITATTSSYMRAMQNTIGSALSSHYSSSSMDEEWVDEGTRPQKLYAGMDYKLPDGALIKIDGHGNYVIHDENIKVIYQACRIREFNRYLNASDLLADFVKYVGGIGVRRSEFRTLSVEAFISWLIISAAEQDGEEKPVEEQKLLTQSVTPVVTPRCLHCRKYLSRERASRGIQFCSGAHMDEYELALTR